AQITNAAAVVSTTGDVTLVADRMALAAGTIGAAAGNVTLRTNTAGRAIDLGSTTDAAAALELSDAELDTVTAASLTIGDGAAGAIAITSGITYGGTLGLITGDTVTQSASLA